MYMVKTIFDTAYLYIKKYILTLLHIYVYVQYKYIRLIYLLFMRFKVNYCYRIK